ncbi:MAG: Lon protease family protein [Planctomycetota bacterium]
MTHPLPADQLRWTCTASDIDRLAPTTVSSATAALKASGVVGQERALDAIRLGMDIPSPGYHIFVTGLVSSGRSYTIQQILQQVATRHSEALDHCYVHNFLDESAPKLISLPRGQGRKLRKEMHELVDAVTDTVSTLFEDEKLRAARDRVAERFQERERAAFGDFEKRLNAAGLTPVSVQNGPYTVSDIFPLVDGKPVPWDQFEQDEELQKKLPEDELIKRRETALGFMEELLALIKDARRSGREMVDQVRSLEKAMVAHTLDGLVASVREEFPEHDGLRQWLDHVRLHMLDNLDSFRRDDDAEPSENNDGELRRRRQRLAGVRRDANWEVGHPHRIFDVNVLHDGADLGDPPVVLERNPTWTNLIGALERDIEPGSMPVTDFMSVRGGSLLRADGGFLVMYCRDVLLEAGVWRTLLRSLKSGHLEIRSPEISLFGPSTLKPEAIPLNLKVILIGDERYYQLLDYYEEDFQKVFKVKAEFDTRVPRTDDNLRGFIMAVKHICDCERLLRPDNGALAALIEEAARRAGRRNRVYTRFGEVADIVREASFAAKNAGRDSVNAGDIHGAIEAHRRRHGLGDDTLQDMLVEELLLVDTHGSRIGQINGLAVYSSGSAVMFGKPSRISASVGPGGAGIMNIEREARLSGSTHDKGVLILSGYLRHVFGQQSPLTLSASLAFEQSYGGVDGDSATCAEFYALVSAIAGVPLRQDVAVTGSMNQLGDVQAIGGVNEKIEGFFRLCDARGLTGTQGCIIPAANVEDLMLHRDVIAAAEAGRFHVWAQRRVEEGLAVLANHPAGEADENGVYPDGTIYRRVHDRLRSWAKLSRAGAGGDTLRVEALEKWKPEPPEGPSDPPLPGP